MIPSEATNNNTVDSFQNNDNGAKYEYWSMFTDQALRLQKTCNLYQARMMEALLIVSLVCVFLHLHCGALVVNSHLTLNLCSSICRFPGRMEDGG